MDDFVCWYMKNNHPGHRFVHWIIFQQFLSWFTFMRCYAAQIECLGNTKYKANILQSCFRQKCHQGYRRGSYIGTFINLEHSSKQCWPIVQHLCGVSYIPHCLKNILWKIQKNCEKWGLNEWHLGSPPRLWAEGKQPHSRGGGDPRCHTRVVSLFTSFFVFWTEYFSNNVKLSCLTTFESYPNK